MGKCHSYKIGKSKWGESPAKYNLSIYAGPLQYGPGDRYSDIYRGSSFNDLLESLEAELGEISSFAAFHIEDYISIKFDKGLRKSQKSRIDNIRKKHQRIIDKAGEEHDKQFEERLKSDPSFKYELQLQWLSKATDGFTKPYKIDPSWW